MQTAGRAQVAIDAMVAEGRSFDEIEDFINEQPLSNDEKSALWLWAWAEQPRGLRRQIVPLTTSAHT